MASLDWGTVPNWVSAIGTVGSLLIALRILWNQLEDRRMEQVRRVSAWCQIEGDDEKWVLAVKNGGNEPVYDCMVYASPLGKSTTFAQIDPSLPLEILFGVIPPGETLKETYEKEVLEPEHFGFPDVEIEFTDASGKHWRRDARGKLKKIQSRKPFD